MKSGLGQVWQHCYLSESSVLAEHLTFASSLWYTPIINNVNTVVCIGGTNTLLFWLGLGLISLVSLTVFTDVLFCYLLGVWTCFLYLVLQKDWEVNWFPFFKLWLVASWNFWKPILSGDPSLEISIFIYDTIPKPRFDGEHLRLLLWLGSKVR